MKSNYKNNYKISFNNFPPKPEPCYILIMVSIYSNLWK